MRLPKIFKIFIIISIIIYLPTAVRAIIINPSTSEQGILVNILEQKFFSDPGTPLSTLTLTDNDLTTGVTLFGELRNDGLMSGAFARFFFNTQPGCEALKFDIAVSSNYGGNVAFCV